MVCAYSTLVTTTNSNNKKCLFFLFSCRVSCLFTFCLFIFFPGLELYTHKNQWHSDFGGTTEQKMNSILCVLYDKVSLFGCEHYDFFRSHLFVYLVRKLCVLFVQFFSYLRSLYTLSLSLARSRSCLRFQVTHTKCLI